MSQARLSRNTESKRSTSRQSTRNNSSKDKKDPATRLQEIENKYPDVFGIEDRKTLRELKKKAIDDFDFDQSDAIQFYINYLEQDNTQRVTKNLQEWLIDSINDTIGNYESNMEEVYQQKEDNEVQLRESVNQIFEEMKKRHIKEIEDNETMRQIEVLREEKREKNEVREMKKQSKNLAKVDEVDQAKMIYKRANEVNEINREVEMNNINEKYNKLLNQICARQRTEIEGLQQRLEDLIKQNEKVLHEDTVYQQKQVAVFIRHTLQKTLNDAARKLNRKENLSKVTQELKNTVIQTLKDQDLLVLLDGELE